MVAPWLLWRYVLRDIALYAVIGLGVVTLTMGTANLLQNLQQLLENNVGLEPALRLTLISLPSYLSFAVPTALLFGVLLAFGHMSADGEIVAMRAAGVSVPGLLPPVLLLGALSVVCTGYILFDVEPRSHMAMRALYKDLIASEELISPGVMRDVGGETVYVSEHGDVTCPLKGVLVADLRDERQPLYITARCASIRSGGEEEDPALGLDLAEGSIHFPPRIDDAYRKIDFLKMHMELDLTLFRRQPKRLRHHSFSELLDIYAKTKRGEDAGLERPPALAELQLEIHRRLAFPLASALLAVIAVPLGIRPVREGRSAGALVATVVMGAYWCVFTAGRVAAETGLIAPIVAMWAPNALLLALGIWLIRRTSRGDV